MTSYDVAFNLYDHAEWQAHFIDEETKAQKTGLHSVERALEMNSEQGCVPAANGDVITQRACWGGGRRPQTSCTCCLHRRITLGFPLNVLLGSDTASSDACLQAWGQHNTAQKWMHLNPMYPWVLHLEFSRPSAVPTPWTPWTESGQKLPCIKCWLCARYCKAVHIILIHKYILLLFPAYRWGNWGSKT